MAEKSQVFKDGVARAVGAVRVNVLVDALSSDYELKQEWEWLETGRLKVFELLPKRDGLLSFIGRWDDTADTVDIDGYDDQSRLIKDFEGHRTVKLCSNPRTFGIEVILNGQTVLKGSIELVLHLQVNKTATISSPQISIKQISMDKEISL
jgi:hypothetical protein